MTRAKQMIDLGHTKLITERCPAAVYFRTMRQGPTGKIRGAPKGVAPNMSTTGYLFLGGTVMEIVTDYRIQQRVIAYLKFMNIREA